ncbi:MAG: pilus assembly protein TadG-related protein [Hyphomicrobiaceae bacterium]
MAVTFALVATGLIGVAGVALDYARLSNIQSSLQSAADAAALAGAKEMSLADANQESVPEIVMAVVRKYADAEGAAEAAAEAKVHSDPLQVEVRLERRISLYFGGLFGMPSTTVQALSIAQVVGQPNICVLALEANEPSAINLMHNARLTGSNCAVFSNSTSASGFAVAQGAQLVASTVCSAGGIAGRGSIAPAPYQDCPQFEDPLANRPEPDVGRCDYTATVISASTATLRPGTYCRGLQIFGQSKVRFEPGVYIIKDGPFLVAGSSEIVGEGVGFFLTGNTFFKFDPLSRIALSAPKSGPLAGLLFFGSRSQSRSLINTILSNHAQVLTGTIYLPTSTFVADSVARIGAESAYTAIVTRRIVLRDGPHLVLNTRYSETEVPVPEGIKAAGQPVRLIK